MDLEYYEVTAQLDAREILRYLNNLGISNISGEVLKYFITDLKKLIKYDLQQRHAISQRKIDLPGPERLHSASTFSSRSRSKTQEGITLICDRDCNKPRRFPNIRNSHSAPILHGQRVEISENKPLRRSCSCIRVEKKSEAINKEKNVITSSKNLIKVPKQPIKKKCDPVSLYHYYTSLWEKYKPNVPGENNWSDLRWNIRQKMAGNIVKPVHTKTPDLQSQDRDGQQAKK